MTFSLYLLLLSSFLLCSMSIFFSLHIIHSLVFLILVFLHASIILMINQLEFLSLIILIIYVGAIAVLFLFIVMMLNLKHVYVSWKLKAGLIAFFITILYYQHKIFYHPEEYNVNTYRSEFNSVGDLCGLTDMEILMIDSFLTNIDIYGQVLFNEYFGAVLLAGLVLLVAVVGAIVLTYNYRQIAFELRKPDVKLPAYVYPLVIKK